MGGHLQKKVKNSGQNRGGEAKYRIPFMNEAENVLGNQPPVTMNEFRQYTKYVKHLENLMLATQGGLEPKYRRTVLHALNGGSSEFLRSRISVSALRSAGAFFSGSSSALNYVPNQRKPKADRVIFDPSCGTGDLLLQAAANWKVYGQLDETLVRWGQHLAGRDIVSPFIQACRLRIALLAISKGARVKGNRVLPLEELLPNIRIGDGLNPNGLFSRSSALLLNPPYTLLQAPTSCSWGSGGISAAAVFLATATEQAPPGTSIVAILPDVLRSGSRYEKWRTHIATMMAEIQLNEIGQFNGYTDIDVFVIKGKKCNHTANNAWPGVKNKPGQTIGDNFGVHVGSVVPHRNPEAGQSYPYLHARNAPAGKEIMRPSETRRFQGTVFSPPFVAIRRTSRPDENIRAVATLIKGSEKIAVENHLIVCLPSDGSLKRCRDLMRILQARKTTNWLNQRIRCRHLTVTSIKEIPAKVNQ